MFRLEFGLRDAIELNSGWRMVPDPMGRSITQEWHLGPRKDEHYFPSFDEAGLWPTVVPSVWNRQHQALEYYEGIVVYLVRFKHPVLENGQRAFIHFEGVADSCQVFLNGNLTGQHDGGWTPFTFEITPYIKADNYLFVRVKTQRNEDTVPGVMHDWSHEGGIHRPVKIYVTKTRFISEVTTQVFIEPLQTKLLLGIRVCDSQNISGGQAEIRIEDQAGRTIKVEAAALYQAAGAMNRVELQFHEGQLKLWSPEEPVLHKVTVTLDNGESWTDLVGFRQIEVQGRTILLNKKQIFLRGVGYLSEDPVTGLTLSNGPEMELLIARLKELSVNFVRAGWYPRGSDLVRRFDREGILLWLEVGAHWHVHMSRPAPCGLALQTITEMITEHRNRASVIIWSVGNECLIHDSENNLSNLDYFTKAVQHCKNEDATRLTSFATGIEGEAMEFDPRSFPEPFRNMVDIIGVNNYGGVQDYSSFEEGRRCLEKAGLLRKPVIISESGVDAVPGTSGPTYDEKFQKCFMENVLAMARELKERGILQGVSLYVLHDYRTPIKWSQYQAGFNRKGLLTSDVKQPKMAFDTVKKLYREFAASDKKDRTPTRTSPELSAPL